jgi:hypothetical protein
MSLCAGLSLATNGSNSRRHLRPAQITTGEKPYLIARVGLNWEVLLQAAPEVEIGSGGVCDRLGCDCRLDERLGGWGDCGVGAPARR